MRLYEDSILVDFKLGETKKLKSGRLSVTAHAKVWTINHSWPLWAIKINDKLILN